MNSPAWNSALNCPEKFVVKSYDDNFFFRTLRRFGWNMAATTIYRTVYMDPAYIGTDRGAEILAHEKVHICDQVAHPIFFFLTYFILPIGPSFKAYWEWKAYQVNIKRAWDQYKDSDPNYALYLIEYQTEWVCKQFWSAGYAWMWPFPWHVRKFVKRYADSLKK